MDYEKPALFPYRIIIWTALVAILAAMACGTEDAGQNTLAGWDVAPSPNSFARQIHPLLLESCGAAACHGRQTTLSLHAPSQPFSGPEVGDPAQLPEPFCTDYFNVLVFCDPQNESQSTLLRWGSGEVNAHPGGAALTAAQRGTVRDWIEGLP